MREQLARYRTYLQTKADAPADLEAFLAPFWQRLHEKTLGNAVTLMTRDEFAELNRLLAAMDEPVRPFTPYAY
ncbi:hypothetical protein ABZ953_08125 [Streptomyces sp. NPDC046465]|uniref:hypothetical protein n=1 Tax=Streptomyces sp. NPDC046465 TaxID=3155810 RepID=UPI0033C5E3B7